MNAVLTESVVFGGRGQDLARVDYLDGGQRREELLGLLRADGLVEVRRRVELKSRGSA